MVIYTIVSLSLKSTVGGEGGSSLSNINAGILKIVTMLLCIRIKNSNSLLSIVSEAESKKKLGIMKLSKLPMGIAILPNAVAVPLSLSPNQVVANLPTGFYRNAYERAAMICPPRTK